jgi:protein-disulfide isomerase
MPQSKQSRSTERAARRDRRREEAIAREQQQKRLRLLAFAGLAALAVAALLIFVNMEDDSSTSRALNIAGIPQNGMTLGSPDAPVTIVEYADYQCPWCGVFAREDMPQIIDDYVRSGQVQIEFRAHPFLGTAELTSPDNESVQAAVAASCANDQGMFWEYNHGLFENQDGENDGGFSRGRLGEIAEESGLDVEAWNTCMDDQTHLDEVLAGLEANQADGVTSTPTIEINGVRVAYTADGYDRLRTQIDAALDGEAIPQ